MGLRLTFAQKISGMFACGTALICGVFIFSKSLPDLNLLLYGLSVIVPASVCTGMMGFLIGKILDSQNKKKSAGQFFK